MFWKMFIRSWGREQNFRVSKNSNEDGRKGLLTSETRYVRRYQEYMYSIGRRRVHKWTGIQVNFYL